ncbi:hypothetical protein M9458_010599, partial [Cirrhinus mrigala]
MYTRVYHVQDDVCDDSSTDGLQVNSVLCLQLRGSGWAPLFPSEPPLWIYMKSCVAATDADISRAARVHPIIINAG